MYDYESYVIYTPNNETKERRNIKRYHLQSNRPKFTTTPVLIVKYETHFIYIIVLSHWPHVATHVATQVAQLVARHVFQWNRSHWRHVATQVADARQFHSPEVAAARRLVAESFHTGDMCAHMSPV